jgi:hypothetical protein
MPARQISHLLDRLIFVVAHQRHLDFAECGIGSQTRQEKRDVNPPEVLFGAPLSVDRDLRGR